MKEYNVDLSIWAHEHDYERFWPLFDYNILNGSLEYPYTEPRGPIHIVSGSAVTIIYSFLSFTIMGTEGREKYIQGEGALMLSINFKPGYWKIRKLKVVFLNTAYSKAD